MVVLDDVFDPLDDVQITSTFMVWLMTGSSVGNVDLGEILFTFQNIDGFPEVMLLHWLGNCDASQSKQPKIRRQNAIKRTGVSHRSDPAIRVFDPMLLEDTVVNKSMEDFDTKCYVMNNEEKLFQ